MVEDGNSNNPSCARNSEVNGTVHSKGIHTYIEGLV